MIFIKKKQVQKNEDFKPISNTAPEGIFGKLKFYARFIFDLQNMTIYRDLRSFLKARKGKVLDIGCGDSPYKHLLSKECKYIGLDIKDQNTFNYKNKDVIFFKGNKIPLKSGTVDLIICTEVLEHVFSTKQLIGEIKRTLKKGGIGFITVPWSARYHYIPFDYYRYTYSCLERLFEGFSSVKIKNRGTDISVICSKIIVVCARLLIPIKPIKVILLPLSVVLLFPLISIAILFGHLSLYFKFGSSDDPLGYSIYIKK